MRLTFHGGLLLAALCAAKTGVTSLEQALSQNELLSLSAVDIEAELDAGKEKDIYKEHDKEKAKRVAKEKKAEKK